MGFDRDRCGSWVLIGGGNRRGSCVLIEWFVDFDRRWRSAWFVGFDQVVEIGWVMDFDRAMDFAWLDFAFWIRIGWFGFVWWWCGD